MAYGVFWYSTPCLDKPTLIALAPRPRWGGTCEGQEQPKQPCQCMDPSHAIIVVSEVFEVHVFNVV